MEQFIRHPAALSDNFAWLSQEEQNAFGVPPFLFSTIKIGILAATYFVATAVGLSLASAAGMMSVVRPETGVALGAILIFGYRMWPGIFIGAFVAGLGSAGSITASFGVAIASSLEALAGAALMNRFANGGKVFDRAPNIAKFAFLGFLVTGAAAAARLSSPSFGEFVEPLEFASMWSNSWLSGSLGCLIVTPLVVLRISHPEVPWNREQKFERVVAFVGFVFVALLVFGSLFPFVGENSPLEFLCVPFLIWAAVRFGQRETAVAIFALCVIAIWGTLRGFGPFAMQTPEESVFLLQCFIGITAVTTMVLSAVVSEHARVARELQYLAVTDPLTGLVNYRKFIEVVNGEIKRSERTGRCFAILFLDVDQLKVLNDFHGHVVGNQALCKVANVVRGSCRAIDTVARFGGDEFALVLPETDEGAALRVADRIVIELAAQTNGPQVTVSVGLAAYPGDGENLESLLTVADGVLYRAKRRYHKTSARGGSQNQSVVKRLRAVNMIVGQRTRNSEQHSKHSHRWSPHPRD